MDTIKLTQYSHGAGCGCKISPRVLDVILKGNTNPLHHGNLLVGNDSRDDAAVFDLGNGTAVISTTDFFMPIVDDPFDFGRIASANAISDVYAMGGTPLMAIAVLGWPVNLIAPEVAAVVLDGSRSICEAAGIPLAGGHSIDSAEPIFGLAVTGIIDIKNLKRNDTAKAGNRLFLTKPIGIGIMSTAQKKGLLTEEHRLMARDNMIQLNKIGARLATLPGVEAMTDVTGFGLLGHLLEMCSGSGVNAVLEFGKIPLFPNLQRYTDNDCIPGGTMRNWNSYGSAIGEITAFQKNVLCDPQTSGGLLIALRPDTISEFKDIMEAEAQQYHEIGSLIPKSGNSVEINIL